MKPLQLLAIASALLLGLAIWLLGGAGDAEANTQDDARAAPPSALSTVLSEPAAEAPASATSPGLIRADAPPAVTPPPRDAIHGRVLRANGDPAVGAEIRLASTPWWPESEEGIVRFEPYGEHVAVAVSAADGSFRFDGPLRGQHRLDVAFEGAQAHRFAVPAGDYVEIVLGAGCRIEGIVRCEAHANEELAGEVWLTEDFFGRKRLLAAPVLPDGSFRFESLPPREYFLTGQIAGHFCFRPFEGVRPIRWGEPVAAELHALPAAPMEGRVVAEISGTPIAGAKVWLDGGNGLAQITDLEGRFHLQEDLPDEDPADDPPLLRAAAPGHDSGEAAFAAGEECVIRLAPAADPALRLTGIVLDAAGRPLAGARVRANTASRPGASGSFRSATETDERGGFALPWPAGAEASLTITSPDRVDYEANLGQVSEDRALGEIRLPALTVWDLRLQDKSGAPVAGAMVSREWRRLPLLPQEESESAALRVAAIDPFARSDSFGRCRFTAERNVPVAVAVELGLSSRWVFQLPASDGSEQELMLENLRRVPCRIRSAAGQVERDFILIVLDEEHPRPSDEDFAGGAPDNWNVFFASADGTAFIEGSFAKEVQLRIYVGGEDAAVECRFERVALDRGPLDLTLPQAVTVEGRVVDSAGRPVADAAILELLDGQEQEILTRDSGEFRIRIWRGQPCTLLARSASGARSEPTEIAAGATELVLRLLD